MLKTNGLICFGGNQELHALVVDLQHYSRDVALALDSHFSINCDLLDPYLDISDSLIRKGWNEVDA